MTSAAQIENVQLEKEAWWIEPSKSAFGKGPPNMVKQLVSTRDSYCFPMGEYWFRQLAYSAVLEPSTLHKILTKLMQQKIKRKHQFNV